MQPKPMSTLLSILLSLVSAGSFLAAIAATLVQVQGPPVLGSSARWFTVFFLSWIVYQLNEIRMAIQRQNTPPAE
jgi:hypothetical protein